MYLASVISGGYRVVVQPYGALWRTMHKIIHSALNINAAKTYIPYQNFESEQMLYDLLEQPDEYKNHLRRYTYSVTSQVTFGYRAPSITDENLQQLFYCFQFFSDAMASTIAGLLNLYPILRSLPDFLLPIRRKTREFHKVELALYMKHWVTARNQIKSGTALPSFSYNLLKAQEEEKFSDEIACYISGTVLEAGSDTAASTLIGFVQAMVLFPEAQKKAQEEIDRVCGDRLPTMDDEFDMQYIRGCVKESLRWMPTLILGVPHAVIRDDEYLGYKIPKDAEVILNTWTIHCDANRYPNPRVFDPSRHADDLQTAAEAAANPDASKRDHFGFGGGRRLCPGLHVAERMLFLGIARMLWGFDIAPAVDGATGEPILPDPLKLVLGGIVHPAPFPAKITPRSEARARSIRDRWAADRARLDAEGQWREVPEGMKFHAYAPDKDKEKE
ncbi:hypothetical protein SLS62_011161 [Diatrype stigma]|uniref:Cytochrome P450 n=1 Tax=Diatrype stigma TaxID=117547 RepID=A0AAN9U5G3_9PEZI